MVEILLTYAHHGASLLRLDAIGFMWKDLGTGCMHLPQVRVLTERTRNSNRMLSTVLCMAWEAPSFLASE